MSTKVLFQDASIRDGLQPVFGARALTKDFISAVEAAVATGITHFETGSGARFQSPFLHCLALFEACPTASLRPRKADLNRKLDGRQRRQLGAWMSESVPALTILLCWCISLSIATPAATQRKAAACRRYLPSPSR